MLDLQQQRVADLVLDHPECAPVLRRHRIDFYCAGTLSLSSACLGRSINTQSILLELQDAIATGPLKRSRDPRTLDTPALIEQIILRHHAYMRAALPIIRGLATQVALVDGARNPKLHRIDDMTRELVDIVTNHLREEETELFPLLLSLDANSDAGQEQLGFMHQDHMLIGMALTQLRVATNDYQPPEWADENYQQLLLELEHFESDTLTHVHLENHVLMPRFEPDLDGA